MNRVDTPIGRALALRSLRLQTGSAPPQAGLLDLTTPETVPVAEHVRAAAKAALDRGETHYVARPGIPELRAAIARRSTVDGYPASVDGTVVTNGGSEALYIALQSTLKPGDIALIGTPIAPNVVDMIEFIGARIERLPLHSERFLPAASDVAAATANVLLIASPSPVTGVAIPPAELQQIVAAALTREMTVILDRTLAWCCFESATARFPDPQLGRRVVTFGSFSTAYGMAGWRVGYLSAPSELITESLELKQAMSICTGAVSQYAALAALEGPPDWLATRRALFAGRRDTLLAALASCDRKMLRPDAWPPLLLDMRWAGPDDVVVAQRMADEDGVVVKPASRYSDALRGFVRIDLGVPQTAFNALIAMLGSRS